MASIGRFKIESFPIGRHSPMVTRHWLADVDVLESIMLTSRVSPTRHVPKSTELEDSLSRGSTMMASNGTCYSTEQSTDANLDKISDSVKWGINSQPHFNNDTKSCNFLFAYMAKINIMYYRKQCFKQK